MWTKAILLLQSALVGSVLGFGMGALVAFVVQRDVLSLSTLFILPGALAASLAAVLSLQGWRRAGGMKSGWTVTRLAMWVVLHLLWIVPALVGLVNLVLSLTDMTASGLDVLNIGLILMVAAIGSAVVWGLPAFAMAWLACKDFLARSNRRALEQRA